MVGRGGCVVKATRTSGFQSKGPGYDTTYAYGYAVSKLGAISFTPLCLCLSEETVKPFVPSVCCLCQQPGEVKDPTQGNGKKTCDGLTNSRGRT